MTVISVSERSAAPDGSFVARVSFGGGAEFEIAVTDPAQPGDEDRLAWYFEEHLRFPFLDQDLVDDAERRLRAYGERLFGQVFAGAAVADYRLLARRGLESCRLQIRGSAAFHRLHWEALYDPELPVPAALRLAVTRRVDLTPGGFELPPERSSLNILVVTARPAGGADVGYRTISRPLLDGLRTADRPVVADLVRPGTWQALRRHLRSATKAHGSGYYQVIHFDVHGAVAGFDDLERGRAADRYLFGSGAPAAFAGERAFLFFETAADGKAEPVSAQEVADLLAEHRVPVAVLNACQSAKEPASESSLAQRLVAAGVPVTVGMAYSVTVSAAEQAMPLLYTGLARGDDPVTAVQTARRSLFDAKARRAYFDRSIDLEDWVLPVVFAQQDVRLSLSEMSVPQQADFYERQAAVGEEPGTEYGFVGRDLDIQAIERRLLIREERTMLLVQGMAGAGKSTLLRHLGWWWQRTGLVEAVFRFSYEDRAWTLTQMLREIAARLLDKVEQAKLELLPAAAQPERIAQLLRARRYLLVLDNTESITATPAAIPHALPEPERDRLAAFLARLRGGQTLVLFGSREDEQWISARTFADNVYRLPGLDRQAASILVDAILTRHGGARHLTDQDQRTALEELTKLLGGYPLPLTVVLPALRTHTPAEVLADLRQGGGDSDPVGVISRAIEYSHGKLDPATQHSLLLLAPFTASIPTAYLGDYQRFLAEHDAVKALGAVDLAAAVAETVRVGLAAPHPQLSNWTQILPVLPYFLRTRISRHPEVRTAAEQAHYRLYSAFGPQIRALLTSTEPPRRTLGNIAVRIEYANLTVALEHGLRTGQPIAAIVGAVEEYLDTTKQLEARSQLVEAAIAAPRPPGRDDLRRELASLRHLAGMVAQDQRRFELSETRYREALELKLELGDRHSAASTYHQLGTVAHYQRQLGSAETHYRQALELLLEFDDRSNAAITYHQLGMVAQDQRRFAEAETYYQQAIELKLQFDNRHGAAATYHQLGTVEHYQWRFEQAEGHYRQALELFLEFDDERSAALVYHQLGMAAQDQKRFGPAEADYRRALELKLRFDDRHGAASTYHQLGMVVHDQGRLDQAMALYQRSLELKLEFNDLHGASFTYHQLGRVAQDRRSFAEAEAHYRRSVEIKLAFDDRHGAASTYHQLGRVALEQQRLEPAEAYFRQALELFLSFDDKRNVAVSCRHLGVVLAAGQRYPEATAALAQAAGIWHGLYGQWPENGVADLREVRPRVSPAEFQRIIREQVAADLVADLDDRTQ